MNPYQQDLRRAADQAFIESLHQLEEILLNDDTASASQEPVEESSSEQATPEHLSHLDLAAFEEAAADIEAFMQQRRS
ncbi:MAG TPA: hypothetical protein DDW76_31095 [Cyanobacteria bacterium UBA11369]|nr:hypothetical protein [Cyanobacteria bacterium UBA11368]HBE53091.1 hypothetical protein [Cyanobacteria bacterium UBA11369]